MTETGTQVTEADSSIDATVVHSTSWDRDTENTPVYAVVSAVAEATDSDLLELPPLNDAIDPDALNAVFTSRANPSVEQVSFRYVGHEVVVQGTGEVHVRPAQEA